MHDQPPEPPDLPRAHVDAIIAWLDAGAAWLREDAAVAARHGHVAGPDSERVLRLHEDAALLFREAYDGR